MCIYIVYICIDSPRGELLEEVDTGNHVTTNNDVLSFALYDELNSAHAINLSHDSSVPASGPSFYDELDFPHAVILPVADPTFCLHIPESLQTAVEPLPAVETPYSGLETSTREPPPVATVYNTIIKPEYININRVETEVMCGKTSDHPQSDAEHSSNDASSSAASYSQLDPSTRELRPAPSDYDTMIQPEYVNTSRAETEAKSGKTSDGPAQNDLER